MAVNKSLNPASEQWGRDVDRANAANEQALIRTTMELQNTDRALGSAITRLNSALETVQAQNDYILSLAIQHVQTKTADVALAQGAWTSNPGLQITITTNSPSGRIKIGASAYGHNVMLTYSIAGVVDRNVAVSSYVQQSSHLVLPGGSVSMTAGKEWVQDVPAGQTVTVVLEIRGIGVDAIVASPAMSVQVLPR